MGDPEQKAIQLMAEAEKKLNSKSIFGSIFGGSSSKVDDAMDLYQQAANKFKMAKKWGSAGQAFMQLAALHEKAGSRLDVATNSIEAANCYKKTDPNEAVNSLLRAIEIYTDMGKFTMAAKHHQGIAEIYETEIADKEKAIQHFEQASDYFKGEESTSSSNKCLLKVAQFAAEMENYEKAVKIYEKVAASSLESTLLKYSAKEYMTRAALCHMCHDVTDAKIAIQKYEDMYPAYQDTRECKLMKSLLGHLEEQNVDAFTDAVKDYDSISRLDQWYTMMLLRIKKTINSEDLC